MLRRGAIRQVTRSNYKLLSKAEGKSSSTNGQTQAYHHGTVRRRNLLAQQFVKINAAEKDVPLDVLRVPMAAAQACLWVAHQ